MVTSKKGSKDKSTVNFKASFGLVSRGIPEYDKLSTNEWVETQYSAIATKYAPILSANYGLTIDQAREVLASDDADWGFVRGWQGGYNPYNVANDQLIDPVTGKINPAAKQTYQDDWNDELFRTAKRSDYALSISGGSEKSTYYLSLGYLNEEGIVKNSDFERLTARLNTNNQVNTWLKVGMNMSTAISKSNYFLANGTYTSNPFYFARMMGPIFPIWQRNADGSFVTDPQTGGKVFDLGGSRPINPNSNLVATLPLDDRSYENNEFGIRTFADITLMEGLIFTFNASGDLYNTYTTTLQDNIS